MKWIGCLTLTLILWVMTGEALAQPQPSDHHQPYQTVSGSHVVYLPAVMKETTVLTQPLLIDGEKGWLFAPAQSSGEAFTIKMSATDGRLLHKYPFAGRIALERAHNRLIIDQGDAGLLILDTVTGAVLATILLPENDPDRAGPQVDPATGLVYAFRNQTIYVVDPAAAAVVHSHTVSIPVLVCDELREDAPIAQTTYDLVNQKLYLFFITYVCTPWVSQTMIAYHAPSLTELGRYGVELYYQAVPFLDSLYGTTMDRLGWRTSWAWNGSTTWFEEARYEAVLLKGIVADWQRHYLYEAWGDTIFIIQAYPREPLGSVYLPWLREDVVLVGHNPITDHLYFLDNGRLRIEDTAPLLFGDTAFTP